MNRESTEVRVCCRCHRPERSGEAIPLRGRHYCTACLVLRFDSPSRVPWEEIPDRLRAVLREAFARRLEAMLADLRAPRGMTERNCDGEE